MTLPRPVVCPRCSGPRAHRIGDLVQPWTKWLTVKLGAVWGCWDCRLTYAVYKDGRVEPLKAKAEPPAERNGTEPKPKLSPEQVSALLSRIGDGDANWGA